MSPPGPHAKSGSARRPSVSPTEAEWRAMSAAERERFVVEVLDGLKESALATGEGRPHVRAKADTLDALRLYYSRSGRTIYLAEEMAVLYAGEETFAPDIFAVLDVAETEDDERMAWVVADEGRGLDLVIEVLHQGDRKKDLIGNVERYARLGIPEYFVYDRRQQRLHGFRLPAPGSAYELIRPHFGRFTSQILGLDLMIIGGRLRFFAGALELIRQADLIDKLEGMVGELQERHDEVQARADEAEAKADHARMGLARALLTILRLRGLALTADDERNIEACADPERLERWLLRAQTAATITEVLAPD